jgi:hypothetical protein
MPGPTPHRTPLRRVSQGSLFALSRSGTHTDAPHGLGFIEPALAELADEAEALRANVDGLRALSASLDTFNESFASWLYVMDMNALTVEWPEVRASDSIHRASFFSFLSLYPRSRNYRHRRKRRTPLRSGGQVRLSLYLIHDRSWWLSGDMLGQRRMRALLLQKLKHLLVRNWTKQRMPPP